MRTETDQSFFWSIPNTSKEVTANGNGREGLTGGKSQIVPEKNIDNRLLASKMKEMKGQLQLGNMVWWWHRFI